MPQQGPQADYYKFLYEGKDDNEPKVNERDIAPEEYELSAKENDSASFLRDDYDDSASDDKAEQGEDLIESKSKTAEDVFDNVVTFDHTSGGAISSLVYSGGDLGETIIQTAFYSPEQKWQRIKNYMSEDEQKQFLSLLATDKNEAKKYLEEYRKFAIDYDKIQKDREVLSFDEDADFFEQAGKRTIGAMWNLTNELVGGLDYAIDVSVQNIENWATGENEQVSRYAGGALELQNAEVGKEAVTQHLTGTTKFLVEVGLGAVNSAVKYAAFGAYAPAVMAIESAGQAAYAARQSGASASQQLMMGLLVAPVEWAGGKVVINQLSKVASTEAAKSGIKSLLKSIGAQVATNFTTEATTEALSIVSELAVMQDKSQAVQYYNDYLQKHPGSESMALVDTMMQQLARIGQAGLAGAVAGGMMGAAATVWHRAQIEQMGHAAQADAQAIIQEGLSYGEGTQAYHQAAEINQQMKEGEHPGDVQLGGLMETNAATDLDRQQITSALESRDGQAVDNEGQAGYAGNKVEGEGIDRDAHTDSGGTEAPAEPTAPQIENAQQSESAETGQGAGAEGDFSHQGVGDAAEGAGGMTSSAKPYANSRPPYGKNQVEDVWNAHVNSKTGKATDPSGVEFSWDRSRPRKGQWDMGHIPGQKYADVHRRYINDEMSLQEFLDWYRNPANYRPELPNTNRSHLFE